MKLVIPNACFPLAPQHQTPATNLQDIPGRHMAYVHMTYVQAIACIGLHQLETLADPWGPSSLCRWGPDAVDCWEWLWEGYRDLPIHIRIFRLS
jgi:hypothetical protein